MKRILLIFISVSLLYGCGNSRRYEITSAGAGASEGQIYGQGLLIKVFVLDTYTGKVWVSYGTPSNNPDSNWVYMGNPTNIKK